MTIDPVNDTREVLAEYAAQFKAMTPSAPDQCDWHFLTGTPDDIETLRRSLGFYDLDRRVDADITRHAAMLLFGNDRTDRWSTSPTQLRDGLIFEPIRRTLGETTQERYGIRKS
jgi:protein SCO1/2